MRRKSPKLRARRREAVDVEVYWARKYDDSGRPYLETTVEHPNEAECQLCREGNCIQKLVDCFSGQLAVVHLHAESFWN